MSLNESIVEDADREESALEWFCNLGHFRQVNALVAAFKGLDVALFKFNIKAIP